MLGIHLEYEESHALVDWFMQAMDAEITAFLKDPGGYNQFVTAHLPLSKRYGKIRRMVIWEGIADAWRFDRELGEETIAKLEKLVGQFSESAPIPSMTANDFFRHCEICYDAVQEFRERGKGLSAREKYKAFADGRHDGLRDIEGGGEAALAKWFRSGRYGGHPFEICRGGNSTHISLYLHKLDEGKGWQLTLAGSSAARLVAHGMVSARTLGAHPACRAVVVRLPARERILQHLL